MSMDQLADLVSKISDIVWNSVLLYLLVGTGILFTIRTRFVQIRKFGAGWKRLFGNFSLNGEKAGKDGMSPFQALTTAIAAQVGTGNIAGAATALYSGGPGAIFWMWLSAFFGMSTIYGEAVLAQKYKTTDKDGHVTGGPIYYIRARFTGKFGKFLAGFFSLAIIFALGFTGNMVQANSISASFKTAFGIPPIVIGVICAIIAAFIFLGGVSRIASVTEKLVPIMACFYIVGCGAILVINHAAIIPALKSIFVAAFDPQAILGGAVGITVQQAMRYGVARGLQGTELAQAAFNTTMGSFGNIFVAICMLFFAFSTIIGWYFFGETNVKALFGKKATKVYAAIVVVCIVIGSALKVDLVWNLSDLFNALMVFPNLIALIFLSGIVARASRGEDIMKK